MSISRVGDDQDRVRANYDGNYARLVTVKGHYDPANLFRLNHNISPWSPLTLNPDVLSTGTGAHHRSGQKDGGEDGKSGSL